MGLRQEDLQSPYYFSLTPKSFSGEDWEAWAVSRVVLGSVSQPNAWVGLLGLHALFRKKGL